MKVGVIGRGTVGDAVFQGLQHLGHRMSFYDPKFTGSRLSDVLDTDLVFICVPTDQAPDGDCDLSIVQSVVDEINGEGYEGIACIKSTVIPGATKELQNKYPSLRMACVPEFLRAKVALADFVYNHDVLVIGSVSDSDAQIIKQVHANIPKNVQIVGPTEAEVIKYFNNVHHAMSIVFANIAYEVCAKVGADYGRVYDSIIQRECFNPSYLAVNANLRGYGGHCLPKDTLAWSRFLTKLGLDFKLIQSVVDDNSRLT
jgi:UDPglucose 6-dehydrogenase